MPIQTFDQSLKSYSGRNSFSENTNLDPSQFWSVVNVDLYERVGGDDYFKGRRGSSRLVPESPIVQLGATFNKVVFPVAGEEYAVCAYDASGGAIAFSYQALLTVGNPVRIKSNKWSFAASDFMSNLVLYGVTASNSSNFTLYFYWDATAGGTLNIYADSALTTLVASCASPVSGTNLIVEEGGSGITGSFFATTPGLSGTGSISYADFEIQYSNGIPDMKVYNNRVFVFQQGGNQIIEWDSAQGKPVIRPMGMSFPYIESWVTDNSPVVGMDVTGAYYYGLEKVNQANGVDLFASTPNRKFTDGTIPLMTPTSGNIILTLDDDSLNDQSWTHIRVWRSKNTVPNFSDPLFPIDAQGTIDQLYELALITRAEIYAAALAPVATGSNLPAGNAGVQAGAGLSGIQILDTNLDDVLSVLVGIDLIELPPFPGVRTGEISKGQLFGSGVGSAYLAPNGEMIDPSIAEDVLYTTTQLSEYGEQWEPQAFIPAGRDGKKTTCLLTLYEDVIVFREGMTKRIQQGNVNAGVVMVDDKIGIPTFRMAGYVPGLGICAICSDKYFRYLNFGLEWMQTIGSTEVSQSVYDLTSASFSDGIADFAYINGKLVMLLPSQGVAALHKKNNKGWTQYDYPYFIQSMFLFSNNSRVATATGEQYLLELETTATKDESPISLTADDIDIDVDFETYGFSGAGQLLEPTRYSFWGKLTSNAEVTAKVSSQAWVMQPTFQDPGLFSATTSLNEREYRFEPEPQDIGVFKWVPLRGQFISFSVSTIAPCMFSWQKLVGRIRKTNGNQQASLAGGIAPQGPGWANQSLMLLNFEDLADTFYDASGKGLNHLWGNVGTKSNRMEQKPGFGVLIGSSGYTNYTPDPVTSLTGVSNLAWKVVFSFLNSGSFYSSGKVGSYFWSLKVVQDTATFMLSNASVAYTWEAEVDIEFGEVYAMTFTLSKLYAGKFYINSLNDDEFSELETTRTVGATPPSGSTTIVGDYAPHLSNLTLTGWDGSPLYGYYFGGPGHSWYIWASAAERDALNPATMVAQVLNLQDSGTLTVQEQNSSGISGTVVNDGDDSGPNSNLDIVQGTGIITGHTISPTGTVSYYEIQKSDPKAEQAERFWGIMKAYP